MKKILTIAVVLGMALVMFTGAAVGHGEVLRGVTINSFDGQGRLSSEAGTVSHGNVTVVHVQVPGDIPIQGSATYFTFADTGATPRTIYSWNAEGFGEHAWVTPPDTVGDNLYFITQAFGANDQWYISATHADVTATTIIKENANHMMNRLEQIPIPIENSKGTDFIEIRIPAFKYTDYSSAAAGNTGQGTFDVVNSYAVFITGGAYADWTHIGNADDFVAGPNAPINAAFDDTDPATVDTGHFLFNTNDVGITLTPGTTYEFAVRVNIGPAGTALGGYGGGLDGYTTWNAGASSGPIETENGVPEFGPGLIVPVVAIIGMFVAFTVYRRKKE